MPFRKENRSATLSFLVIVVSAMLVFGAVQYKLAQEGEDDRADYAQCLGEWGQDFAETVQTRTGATKRLERAIATKDDALDQLLAITELLGRKPPEASPADFNRALDARVKAQRQYDRVAARVAEVRERNPYEVPEVTCSKEDAR